MTGDSTIDYIVSLMLGGLFKMFCLGLLLVACFFIGYWLKVSISKKIQSKKSLALERDKSSSPYLSSIKLRF